MKKDDSGYTNFDTPISVVYGAGIPIQPNDHIPEVTVTTNNTFIKPDWNTEMLLIAREDLEHILSILESMVNPEVEYSKDHGKMMNKIISDSREKSLNLIKYIEENIKGSLGLIVKLGLGDLKIK